MTDPVVLADGTVAIVRELRPSDRPAVEDLFAGVAVEDLYTRFFTLGRTVVEHHVRHLFTAGTGTITYVVERDGRLLGIADVEPEGDDRAEVAFLVADGAHGLGVATLLLERAAEDAWARGVTTFVADVLAVNHAMLEVFRYAGFEAELVGQHDDVSVHMSTCRTPEARAATAARHESAIAHQNPGVS
ncbi:hypothetical protein C6I20_15280 [Aeromicrobium sp. A1-2]|nr:hypothetical protein C6I20_15280 [Aeromicrobium sp. A1-2]